MSIENKIQTIQETYGRKLAAAAFQLRAIRLQPDDPFTWASGYRMPIYNDNRQFLRDSTLRALIAEGFTKLMDVLEFTPDRIAGTATAGIPHATTLADAAKLPLLYVRGSQKKHGLQNAIEGMEPGTDLSGERLLLIEDLISTGGSSVRAVHSLLEAGAEVPWCFAIFSYGLQAADTAFAEIEPACAFTTLLSYSVMVDEAQRVGYVSSDNAEALKQWRISPMTWGEERGFPRVMKD